jgi:hypothetical protein
MRFFTLPFFLRCRFHALKRSIAVRNCQKLFPSSEAKLAAYFAFPHWPINLDTSFLRHGNTHCDDPDPLRVRCARQNRCVKRLLISICP